MISFSSFRPSWWARNRHVQTIFPRFFQRRQPLTLRHQNWELADGDFVQLSWAPKPAECRGIAVLFHGLEGSWHSHYAHDMMAVLAAQGWQSVLMHFRGCGEQPNRLHRTYHSGDTADARALLSWLRKQYVGMPVVAVGFSLGANMLLKLLGEAPEQNLLEGAVCISPPFRLQECADAVDQGFSRQYQRYLLGSMVRKLQAKMTQLDYSRHLSVSAEQLATLTTFRQFDELVTSRLHGFDGADDYYQRCSADKFSRHIVTPTLIVHAKDDPFMNEAVIPRADELSPSIQLELSENGGHVGFLQGSPWRPRVWLHQRVPAFINQFAPLP